MLSSTSSSILLASVLLLLGSGTSVEGADGSLVGRGKHGSEMRRMGGGKGGHAGVVHGRAEKRQGSNARMTYYYTDVGLGACGQLHQNSEYTLAMNSNQFNGGSVCGQTITITYNGVTASALIADECPTCAYGELDLSPGLFTHFASTDAGQIYGSWVFGTGSTPETTTTTTTAAAPSPTTTTTTTKQADPTTTSTSTSEYVAPTTSSSALPSSSAIPSSSAAASASASSYLSSASASASQTGSAAAPAASASAGASGSNSVEGVNILAALGEAVNGLGSVVCAGSEGCVV
ncbi:RlpA-like double-psi beta-barrel-protein domain-containing protein-containing protein [Mrakia frigida]|uniref:RlpA-like double-psi beta-barrel domain-containing protein n=1 Tax=Mrakia frigida TaxID=29902 RepID=UPI003FCBF937